MVQQLRLAWGFHLQSAGCSKPWETTNESESHSHGIQAKQPNSRDSNFASAWTAWMGGGNNALRAAPCCQPPQASPLSLDIMLFSSWTTVALELIGDSAAHWKKMPISSQKRIGKHWKVIKNYSKHSKPPRNSLDHCNPEANMLSKQCDSTTFQPLDVWATNNC